jgi:quinoprotein glucose dehydrogenase
MLCVNVLPQPVRARHLGGRLPTYTGNISPWAPLSADSAKGLVFIPTDTPTNDYYGGHRGGANLFGTSLIALDAKTGKRVWHYQLVHHDIWNYDIPDAPHVLDVTVRGKRTPIVAQATKQGFLYVFNRDTGEPIWPMEERKVPQSDSPGEKTWATQPFPTRPAPFEMQGITEDDLIDLTPEIKQEAIAIAKQYRMGPLFTPPSLWPRPTAPGRLQVPGANRERTSRAGAVIETGIIYVATERGHSDLPHPGSEQGKGLGAATKRELRSRGREASMIPLLAALGSMATTSIGRPLFQVANGDPAKIKNHPLQGLTFRHRQRHPPPCS